MLLGMMVVDSCKVKERHFLDEPPPKSYEYFSISEKDTEIVVPSVQFDTIFKFVNDTIFITDEKTKIKVKLVKLAGDSIWLKPECPPDTVYVTKYRVEQKSETVIERRKKNNVVLIVVLTIIGLFASGYVINAIKR